MSSLIPLTSTWITDFTACTPHPAAQPEQRDAVPPAACRFQRAFLQLHQQNQNEQDRGEHGANHTLKDGDGATLAANSLQQSIHGVAAEIGERDEVNIPDDLPAPAPG